MNIDYHALLSINGKTFDANSGKYVAKVLNIPSPSQNSNQVCYVIRFEGKEPRQLNLWVAQETLMLRENGEREVFDAVRSWLDTDEGYKDRPDRFFDEPTTSLIPYDPEKGAIRDQTASPGGDGFESLLSKLDPAFRAAFRAAGSMEDPVKRIDSLIGLAADLPESQAQEVYREAINIVQKIPDINKRRDGAVHLAPLLPGHLLLSLVEHFKNEYNVHNRAVLINSLLSHLPLSSLADLTDYAETLQSPDARDSILASLARTLGAKGEVQKAFDLVERISERQLHDSVAETLFSLARRRSALKPSESSSTPGQIAGQTKAQEKQTPSDSESSATPANELFKIALRASADTPNEDVDLLDFADYADALADLIKSDKTERPIAIGIDAAWGMGKTQLMKMVKKRLTENLRGDLPSRSAFPTVWFNAWKYDKEDTLWAALVLEILNAVEKELKTWERFGFHLKLKWKRLDKDLLFRAIVWSALWLTVSTALWALLYKIPFLNQYTVQLKGAIGVTTAAAAAYSIRNIYQQIKPLEKRLSKFVKNPDYEEKIGFLARFQEDFGRVIDLVTDGGKWPLVVFIDDLDRCAPTKTVQVIEAISVLLDANHCVFIVGMDMRTVAHSIQTKYKFLEGAYPNDPGGMNLGQRFLEKIIQINFRIPRSDILQVGRLINNHLELAHKGEQSELVETHEKSGERLAEEIILAEKRGDKDISLSDAAQLAAVTIVKSGAASSDDVNRASEALRAKAFDDDENVQSAVREAAPYLDFNPRKIQRFINNFRLYALVAQKRQLLGGSGFTIGLLAKAVVISMRWPDLALHIIQEGDICETLRNVCKAKSEDDQERFVSARNRLLKLSAWDDVERLINSADLSTLLIAINETDIEKLPLCFRLESSHESGE